MEHRIVWVLLLWNRGVCVYTQGIFFFSLFALVLFVVTVFETRYCYVTLAGLELTEFLDFAS